MPREHQMLSVGTTLSGVGVIMGVIFGALALTGFVNFWLGVGLASIGLLLLFVYAPRFHSSVGLLRFSTVCFALLLALMLYRRYQEVRRGLSVSVSPELIKLVGDDWITPETITVSNPVDSTRYGIYLELAPSSSDVQFETEGSERCVIAQLGMRDGTWVYKINRLGPKQDCQFSLRGRTMSGRPGEIVVSLYERRSIGPEMLYK